jgi:hypothetical protein
VKEAEEEVLASRTRTYGDQELSDAITIGDCDGISCIDNRKRQLVISDLLLSLTGRDAFEEGRAENLPCRRGLNRKSDRTARDCGP